MFGIRAGWWETAMIALVTMTGTGVMAADTGPEAVLKARGLKKAGLIYVLDGESDFLGELAKIQPLYDQMRKSYANLAAVMQNQTAYDEMDYQYTLVTERLRDVWAEQDAFPSTSNNVLKQQWQELLELERQLRLQRNQLNRELDLRYKTLVSESKRERLMNDFQKLRQDFLKESRDLRDQADNIGENYDRLAKDDAVKKALDSIRTATKARVALGPSPEFKRRSALLRNAERAFSPESLTPKKKLRDGKGTKRGSPSSTSKPSNRAK
jgi:hypothetical protein